MASLTPNDEGLPKCADLTTIEAEIKRIEETLGTKRSPEYKDKARLLEELELARQLATLSKDPAFWATFEFVRRIIILSRSFHRPFDDQFAKVAEIACVEWKRPKPSYLS